MTTSSSNNMYAAMGYMAHNSAVNIGKTVPKILVFGTVGFLLKNELKCLLKALSIKCYKIGGES